MENLKKENVFVIADTKEKALELYQVLLRSPFPNWPDLMERLKSGNTNTPYIGFRSRVFDGRYRGSVGGDYFRRFRDEVSIQQLSDILGVDINKKVPTASVKRNLLKIIYPLVCSTWQGRIDSLIEQADKFTNKISVPYELVKLAKWEANTQQTEWLTKSVKIK